MDFLLYTKIDSPPYCQSPPDNATVPPPVHLLEFRFGFREWRGRRQGLLSTARGLVSSAEVEVVAQKGFRRV
jgi:hypothetical protein